MCSLQVKNVKGFIITDLLVSFYFGLVVVFSFIEDVDLLWLLFPTSLVFAIFFFISCGVRGIGDLFHIRSLSYETREIRKTAFWCGIVVLFGQMIYWMAFYPGGFNLDALGHWDQAHGVMAIGNHSVDDFAHSTNAVFRKVLDEVQRV